MKRIEWKLAAAAIVAAAAAADIHETEIAGSPAYSAVLRKRH